VREDDAVTTRDLPERALDTSAERPWPVRVLTLKITQYIDRMAPVWVEGQVVELNRRAGTCFLTLRDPDTDMSLPVSVPVRILSGVDAPLGDGAHVVVHAKPSFWPKRGTFQLAADDVRPVGVGELLARVERLRRLLAAEGLFDASRKVSPPFLPAVVGLVCGRESKAERDVVVNARARWPSIAFEVREVAVQGPSAVAQVGAALAELDADPRVQVIVLARGGGSVEDLLPFSNETLVRAVAACRTPVVSAIGHEADVPLVDLVADVRASTPTDAAKRIVPDVTEERARVAQALARGRGATARLLEREQAALAALRARPALRTPATMVDGRVQDLGRLRAAALDRVTARLALTQAEVARLSGQLRALSPAATLERGYAVVQRTDGAVVRGPADVRVGESLRVRLARGDVGAVVTASTSSANPADGAGVD
jgi:exodeoxyribonuclease VII large subunit